VALPSGCTCQLLRGDRGTLAVHARCTGTDGPLPVLLCGNHDTTTPPGRTLSIRLQRCVSPLRYGCLSLASWKGLCRPHLDGIALRNARWKSVYSCSQLHVPITSLAANNRLRRNSSLVESGGLLWATRPYHNGRPCRTRRCEPTYLYGEGLHWRGSTTQRKAVGLI